MPIINITILPQSIEKKAEIAKVFTEELHRITGIPTQVMLVIFDEKPAENFASNGELLSEQFKRK